MSIVHSLLGISPPARSDGKPWNRVRIEHSTTNGTPWIEDETRALDPIDPSPAEPQERDFTFTSTETVAYFRLTFLDADDNESAPMESMLDDGSWEGWRPTVAQVGAILRARTYAAGKVDPENPMAVLAGGALLGEFTENTRPTPQQVEGYIDLAIADVSMRVGVEIPESLRPSAQRITAGRAASEIERSYIPEQSDGAQTIFQTLRISFEEEVAQLARNVQWHSLAGFMEKLPD